MFKKMFLVLTILALPMVLFAKDESQRSLKFGEKGANSPAKVHVYIDKDEPAPRCKCVRFSVLVDDRVAGLVGAPFIEKVVVIVDGLDSEASRVLTPQTIWRHLGSPAKTSQVLVELPIGTDLADVRFKILALKRRALHPEHDELVIDTQGEFSGEDVDPLKPSKVSDLLQGGYK